MNKIFKIIIIVLVGVAQLTLVPIFQVKGIYPNVILIGALTLTLLDFEQDAYLLAAIGGLVLDLGGFKIFGLNTIILVGLVFITRFISVRYLPDINILIFALAIFIFNSIYVLLINIIGGQFAGYYLLIDGLYSVILAMIWFWQVHKFHGQTNKMESINK